MLTPPPMIHPNLLLASSGSWEVGNLRCEVPPNSPNLSNYGPARLIDARIFGILWKLEPGEVFALQALQTLGKFEPGDVSATSDAKTPPVSNFPRICEAGSAKTSPDSYVHKCMHAFMPTYVHTHACIYIYTHVYMVQRC